MNIEEGVRSPVWIWCYVEAFGHTPQSADPLFTITDGPPLKHFIDDVCKHLWDCNDGWDWLKDGTKLTIAYGNDLKPGDNWETFRIEVEFEPTFTSEPV